MPKGEIARVQYDPPLEEPPLLAGLRAYWNAKRGGRAMPARRDIVPGEIEDWLHSVILLDVVEDDFRYRIVGNSLLDSFTSAPAGRLMSEALAPFGPETVAATLATYRRVAKTRTPLRVRGPGAVYRQGLKYFDSILMPLSEDGGTVDMVFGGFFFEWDRGHEYRPAIEDPRVWLRAMKVGI
jgi:hypothetical protein